MTPRFCWGHYNMAFTIMQFLDFMDTDICVVSNALLLKAYLPETPIHVIASCCAGVTPESHQAALKTMQMCQIDIQE